MLWICRVRFLHVLACALLVSVMVAGCAYPRRGTALSTVRDSAGLSSPSDVVRIRFLSAQISPRERSGLEWDSDGTGPDTIIRIYRDDTLIYESEPYPNSIAPEFGFTSGNLSLPASSVVRIELWDDDGLTAATIGTWRGRGLPQNALPGADAALMLEGRSQLMFRVVHPQAFRGVGIEEYEYRGESLKVLSVIRRSPAGRAGVEVGDEIVSVGTQKIDDLDEVRAASAISMAGSRPTTITVQRGTEREVLELDGGYTWTAD